MTAHTGIWGPSEDIVKKGDFLFDWPHFQHDHPLAKQRGRESPILKVQKQEEALSKVLILVFESGFCAIPLRI